MPPLHHRKTLLYSSNQSPIPRPLQSLIKVALNFSLKVKNNSTWLSEICGFTAKKTPANCIASGEYCISNSPRCEPLPSIAQINCAASSASSVRLPSIGEFDQGVAQLERSYGPTQPRSSPSPYPSSLPSLSRVGSVCFQPPAPTQQQTLPRLNRYGSASDLHQTYSLGDMYDSGIEGYPSPPLDGENRHINQKYTTEQGDYIIYAWHDKKLKWQRIKHDFAIMFGTKPKRTVQGLQAWYYRMNQRIPCWDKDGWLIFDNDEELEPKQISIKCRESNEPLGLAERYPERAMHYSWVDPELKRKARDWGE